MTECESPVTDSSYRCVHCGSTEDFKRRRDDLRWECVNVDKCSARQAQRDAEEDLS